MIDYRSREGVGGIRWESEKGKYQKGRIKVTCCKNWDCAFEGDVERRMAAAHCSIRYSTFVIWPTFPSYRFTMGEPTRRFFASMSVLRLSLAVSHCS